MNLEIREGRIGSLGEHATISIAYLVDKILVRSVLTEGLGGIVLHESAVDTPWPKDYDAIKGEGPTRWPKRFDVTNWGLIAAYQYGVRVGGAVVAFTTPHLAMLDEESDSAALWDIRIRPDLRQSGIGSHLFRAVHCGHAYEGALRCVSTHRMSTFPTVISTQQWATPTSPMPSPAMIKGRNDPCRKTKSATIMVVSGVHALIRRASTAEICISP